MLSPKHVVLTALCIVQSIYGVSSQETKHLLVFGDSYSSTSSWAGGEAPSSANPIGNPSFPGQTTSGGINWVGQAITELNTTLVLSYDFAVSGATIDTAIVSTWAGSGVDDQVDLFGQYVAGTASLDWGNTLVAVWVGINDVGHPYWDGIESPTERIMQRYLELLEILYDHGARQFVLFTVPPFDQAPAFLGEPAEKVEELRGDIELHNEEIRNVLETLKASHTDVTGQIFDTIPSFETVLADPPAYGAPDATCVNTDGVSCLWYDTYHPGIAIQKVVAEALVDSIDFF